MMMGSMECSIWIYLIEVISKTKLQSISWSNFLKDEDMEN